MHEYSDWDYSLDHWTSHTNALLIMNTNRFKLSHVAALNDPEEGYAILQGKVEFQDETILDQLSSIRATAYNIYIGSFSNHSGKMWTSPLWNHYGHKGKGAAINFKMNSKKLHENGLYLRKVIYVHRSGVVSDHLRLNKADITDLYSIKYKDWEYEEEYRIIKIDTDDYSPSKTHYIDLTYDVGIETSNVTPGPDNPEPDYLFKPPLWAKYARELRKERDEDETRL